MSVQLRARAEETETEEKERNGAQKRKKKKAESRRGRGQLAVGCVPDPECIYILLGGHAFVGKSPATRKV